MPSLMLRGLPADLVARLRALARGRAVSLSDVAAEMLTLGLQMTAGRAAGAEAVNAAMTPEERSERARRGAAARWAKRDEPTI